MLFSMLFNMVPDLVSWLIQLNWVISRREGEKEKKKARGKGKKKISVIYRDLQGQIVSLSSGKISETSFLPFFFRHFFAFNDSSNVSFFFI